MPLAPAAIATIAGGALTAGTGIFQAIGAGKRARQAQKAIKEYDRQELTNPYANLQVSTAGADLQRADIARSVSTFADNAALGGSRAVLGLLPNVLQQQIGQEQKIAADLDQQYIQNTQLAAQGAGMVQQMQEQRENADLAGLGQALQTARQERANGINTIAQGAMGVMGAAAGGLFGKTQTPTLTGGAGATIVNPGSQLVNNPQPAPQLNNSILIKQPPAYLNSRLQGVIRPAWMNLTYAQPTYIGD